MENNTQHTFGSYLPEHVKADLIKARQVKDGQEQDGSFDNKEEQEEVVGQPEVQADTKSQTETEPQSEQSESDAPNSEESNDAKAWKGRLKKEQEERQKINARLIEEAEARESAEAKLRELEEKAKQNQQTQSQPDSDPKGLSDKDLEEIKLINPELYNRLSAQRNKPTVAPTQPEQPITPTQPTSQAQQQTISERDRIWYSEISREIPEIQGMLGDSDFLEFAKGKADWTGVTGLELIEKAGKNKDVRVIPAIRSLLDEYNQSKEKPPETVTAPPQKSVPVKAKVNSPKEMTEKDKIHAESLARKGKTKELKEFLAKFKKQ